MSNPNDDGATEAIAANEADVKATHAIAPARALSMLLECTVSNECEECRTALVQFLTEMGNPETVDFHPFVPCHHCGSEVRDNYERGPVCINPSCYYYVAAGGAA